MPAPIASVAEGAEAWRAHNCLACHGAPEQIPAEVAAILAERYPDDQATGYAVGDLRGALWAEVRLPVGP